MIVNVTNKSHQRSPAREPFEVWVCVDCWYAHHGIGDEGDVIPEREPLSLIGDDVEVTAGLVHGKDRPVHEDGEECDCDYITFSWSPCGGCGSTLGGSRHALTVWVND